MDTSAIMAMANPTDELHEKAKGAFQSLRPAELVTTSYVFLESVALIQRRLGLREAVEAGEALSAGYTIVWVEPQLHQLGWHAFRAQGRRLLSMVDCVSFEAMRQMGLRRAFAFDRHFEEAGFEVVP